MRKTIVITEKLNKKLKKASNSRLSQSEIVRQALDDYFGKSVTTNKNPRKRD